MGWKTRSLPGSSGHRPSPKWVTDEELKISMAIAVWGNAGPATAETEFLKSLRQSAPVSETPSPEADPDATVVRAAAPRPAAVASPLTAARLGLAMQSWNGKIAKADNASRWQVAVEAVALRREGALLQWSWAGEFSLLASTPRGTELLAHQRASRQPGQLSPLPTLGLGLETTAALVQGETALSAEARLLLLYSSSLPGSLLHGPLPHFDEILRVLSEEAPEVPHWVALFEP
jgi:hypothetical protein